MRLKRAFLALALGLCVPSFAHAQSASAPDVAGFRTFATWPDDAGVLAPGEGLVSLSLATWRWAFGDGIGLPGVYGTVGVCRRLEFGGGVERDVSRYVDKTKNTSYGDRYLVAKIQLVKSDRVDVGVSPMLQILSDPSLTYYRYY